MTHPRFRTTAPIAVRTLCLLLVSTPVWAQIPVIDEPVTTAFGTYVPPVVEVSPDAAWYEVQSGLANVVNAEHFDLSDEAKALLEHQAFVVVVGREPLYHQTIPILDAYANLQDVYIEAEQAGVPSFVTTDAMLHVFHRVFDHSLKTTEEDYLAAETAELTTRLLNGIQDVYHQAGNDEVRAAARLAAGHLAVGLLLLDPDAEVASWLEPEISAEVQLIEDAAERVPSPLFDAYWEDYTQYKPRGHYTRSEGLRRYFKAMMWFGRMTFALREMDEFCQPLDQRPDLAAAALLQVRQLLLVVDGTAELQRWHRIYDPTEFFVGSSDDLMYRHYEELALSVYGSPLDRLTPEQVCDPVSLQIFMDRAEAELPEPRINGNAPKGLRLFGQRFLPDSWFLSEMVHDAVRDRLMPSVLDVMSVLGSAEAEVLQRINGAENYTGYVDQLEMLREDVRTGPPERWAATLYWNWIYSMAPLLETWGEGFPPYMASAAWPRRQLMAAAGTWTELRHDTILYAKQSNTPPWTSPPPVPPFVQGAVEPNPWLFARLGALAAYARFGLRDLDILDDQVAAKLEAMEEGALLLADAAVRELERRPLNNDEHRFIFSFGQWMSELLNLDDNGPGTTDEDDFSPVVADVHTDPNLELVLEEGTGFAGRIFVVTDVEGSLTLCVGAVFIPFEFTHPVADRLTDEAWWEMLATNPPDLPWWTEPTLSQESVPVAAGPAIGAGYFVLPDVRVQLGEDTVDLGEDLVLDCNPAATRVRVLRDGSTLRVIDVPSGGGAVVRISTDDLAPGELLVVADLIDSNTYATRASVVEPQVRVRRGGGRIGP